MKNWSGYAVGTVFDNYLNYFSPVQNLVGKNKIKKRLKLQAQPNMIPKHG